MARYAPLPVVSIDPQNEADLVQLASQTVYESSNRTLNDFSAGNPLAALIEGQVFAQGEFLFWLNQFPQKILVEWIGPFLGAMRRLGTPAAAQLDVSVSPSNTATVIPAGTSFSTDPQLTGGVRITFLSTEDLVIPAGQSSGKVAVYSQFVGSENNVPANSITGVSVNSSTPLAVNNPKPAAGGSDVETFTEVQERFFSQIRRPNPVSETDWQNFFIDLFGEGTVTSVQPNRSSFYGYNYSSDYETSNGEVSFFVLGPGGVELTPEQLRIGQNVVNFSVPVENRGNLFPITLSEVQYDLTLEVEANGSFGLNFRDSSLNFRDRLFSILTPGSTFPADVNPTVSDIDAAFYNSFDSNTRFRDPLIIRSVAYNTPNTLNKSVATYTRVYDFEPSDSVIQERDLVLVNSPNPTFYPALSSFTPYSSSKSDQTLYGNLSLKQIKLLTTGNFNLGDIVYYGGEGNINEKGLHVVLENLRISSSSDILLSIQSGKISGVKTYKYWMTGNTYQYTSGSNIDPDIVQYDYEQSEFTPATPSNVPLENRPGSFAWLVTKDFTLSASSNNITGAQIENLLGLEITPQTLEPGSSYTAGMWVSTPQVGSGPNSIADPYYNFVDITEGVVVKYAFVSSSFVYNPNQETVSDYFDSLVEGGVLQEVAVFEGDNGLPLYKYKSRFKTGQYLLYRETANSQESYFIAAKDFTPDSSNTQSLLNRSLIYNLAPTPDLQNQLKLELGSGIPGRLSSVTVSDSGAGYVNGTYENVPVISGMSGYEATLNITVSSGQVTAVFVNSPGRYYQQGEILTVDSEFLGGSGGGAAFKVKLLAKSSDSSLKTL
jgi:hypothetical protein